MDEATKKRWMDFFDEMEACARSALQEIVRTGRPVEKTAFIDLVAGETVANLVEKGLPYPTEARAWVVKAFQADLFDDGLPMNPLDAIQALRDLASEL